MIAWLLAVSLGLSAAAAEAHTVPGPDPVPQPEAVLAVPPALRAQLQTHVLDASDLPPRRLELLVDFMFDDDGLGLRYRHDATYTVAEAHARREANCLTFSLVAIVLAREAGLEAYGQELRDALSWQQQGDNIVLSNHVNAGVRIQQRRFTIDVAADQVLARDPPRRIGDGQLLAMFYSNRAMERVLAEDLAGALPYMQLSLQLDPLSPTGWNNAGVIHLRSGDNAGAERDYLRALELRPSHLGALSNLAALYRQQGRTAAVERLLRQSRAVMRRDPFQQFISGHEAEKRGDYAQAIRYYRQAIRLHRGELRFHEALARAYLHVGNTRAAARALQKGAAQSDDPRGARYQAKLDRLRATQPRR